MSESKEPTKSSVSALEKDESIVMTAKNKNSGETKEKDIPSDIPSPFKNNLFWPETPKVAVKIKEKIPSVATSKNWQEYYRKKQNKKLEHEKQVQERKRKRLEMQEMKKNAQTAQKLKKCIKEPSQIKNDEKRKTLDSNNNSWYCHICEEDCQEDTIKCQICLKWMHERCAMVTKKNKKIYLSNL